MPLRISDKIAKANSAEPFQTASLEAAYTFCCLKNKENNGTCMLFFSLLHLKIFMIAKRL